MKDAKMLIQKVSIHLNFLCITPISKIMRCEIRIRENHCHPCADLLFKNCNTVTVTLVIDDIDYE